MKALQPVIVVAHIALANYTGIPAWQIQDEEADALGTAAVNVLRHYGITTTGKVADWAALAVVMMSIYGGRIVHHIDVMKNRAAGRPDNGATVTPFPSRPVPPAPAPAEDVLAHLVPPPSAI